MVERVVFAALYPMKGERAMSGHDPVFYEAAADYVMDDIDRAASKLRERSAEMSDLVEAGLAEWTDSSEARQAQKECAQRLNDRAEELAAASDSLKQAFEEIRKAGVNAETLAFAAVD
nr:pyrroloquinoline-quinone synthase [Schaalia odontolytica]